MITVYFGSPGSGKTTMAVRRLIKQRKFYDHTFANFETSAAEYDNVSLAGLGEWTFPPYSLIEIDEAGIEYNNRKYKTLPMETIKWFKLHRHYRCDVDIWSQSWEDMDVTLRRLADRLYYIRRIGPFTMIRRVYKRVTIDQESEQIVDGYKMVHMAYLLLKPLYNLSFLVGIGFILEQLFPQFNEVQLVWRPTYYKYFDTHSAPVLPLKVFGVPRKVQTGLAYSIQHIGNSAKMRTRIVADRLRDLIQQGVKTPIQNLFRRVTDAVRRRRP